jgi:hypothetical protein
MLSTSLEDLPAELITAILYALASPTALRSLIQASVRCYKIFLLSKSDILATTLRAFLRPEIKSLILMVHEAYHLPAFDASAWSFRRRNDRDGLDAFMDKFSRYHHFDEQVLHLPTPHFVVSQLRTICTMEYFVEDYCNWVSEYLYLTKVHSPATDAATGLLSPLRIHQSLSSVERLRLQRAFLRFEIFCTSMHAAGGHDRAPSARYYSQRNNDRFLNILQPWEREEWVCVLDYLSARVGGVFDKLELDYVEGMAERFLSGEVDLDAPAVYHSSSTSNKTDTNQISVSIPGAQVPTPPEPQINGGQPEAHIDHSANFFTTKAKRNLHTHYVAHIITLGLPFLRGLFRGPLKVQRDLVFSNLRLGVAMSDLITQKWMNRDQASLLRRQGTDISTQAHRYRRLGAAATIAPNAAGGAAVPATLTGLALPGDLTDLAAQDNQRVLTFEGDMLEKPNRAFLWTHGFTGTNVCSGACDQIHRRLGYVFWDEERLNSMWFFKERHNSPKWSMWRRYLQRQRVEEKSAHERLADMGFVIPVVERKEKEKEQEKGKENTWLVARSG